MMRNEPSYPHDSAAGSGAQAGDGVDPASLLELAGRNESPEAAVCLKIARARFKAGDLPGAYEWLARVADSPGPFVAWASAATALAQFEAAGRPVTRRSVRVAIAGSYTTSQLGPLLRLAALRRGVFVQFYEAGFDTYAQEILDPGSALYAFDPDYVLLAPHEGAVRFRRSSTTCSARWTARSGAGSHCGTRSSPTHARE